MKIIDKRKHYEYDTDYNEEELLKLSNLILEFLQSKENTNAKTLYEMISYFYDIKLEAFDYVNYINKKTNTVYCATTSIPTERVIQDLQSEGHGRDFSWWTQNYQRMIKVATKGFTPSKEEYTYEEIKNLIDEGQIYPIYPYGEKTNKKVHYVEDKLEYLVSYQSKELESTDEYFDYIVQDILKQIGYKTLLKDVEEFTIKLKLNSYMTSDEDYKSLEEIANKLIETHNENNKNNTINPSPVETVVQYLRDLPYEEF